MKKQILQSAVLALGLLGTVSAVEAAPQNAPAPNSSISEAFGAPVAGKALADSRGGFLIQTSSAELTAHLNDNSAWSVNNGANSISGSAFQGSSGIPTVVQNSGNNVIIQSATVLNVAVH